MAKCAYCGTSILFGGKKVDDLRFCDDKCLSRGQTLISARSVPNEQVLKHAQAIHTGRCPVCKGDHGPVDVHNSHKIISFIFMSSWSSKPRISCRSCGVKAQLGAMAYSLVLGWWGIPWGLIMTPVQVSKNLFGMMRNNQTGEPSEQLKELVRNNLAMQTTAPSRR